MAIGLGSILNIGSGALNASQNAIQTTGNNISNVNTIGYSRQAVRLVERPSLNSSPGQLGLGVEVAEVYRYFDRFIEQSYLGRNSQQYRFNAEYKMLSNVETLFNESVSSGIGSAMSGLFEGFNKLALEPSSQAVRESLLQQANILATTIANAQDTMEKQRLQMDKLIASDVEEANRLIKDIASLNREINALTVEGRQNANNLMDQRDLKVRELSAIMNISVQDNGAGDYNVSTGMGYLLVQQDIPYSLQFGGYNVDKVLSNSSQYEGTMGFEGTDGYEYTIEIVDSGTVDNTGDPNPAPGTATYRVSLDGGKTWVSNEDGSAKLFYATDQEHSAQVKDLQLYFTDTGSSLSSGDRFVLAPKNDVFWVSPTSDPINISPQIYADGTDNNHRITGGSLGGNLVFRDYQIGQYMDRLDALAEGVIWEVNRIHSQGSGLERMSSLHGTEQVGRTDIPLGSASSAFKWADKLSDGNMSFAIYDADTGESIIPYPGIDVFSPENFDPTQHSLSDVVKALNSGPAGEYLEASIVGGQLSLSAKSGYTFGIVNDTTGLAAGLGINTFFQGNDAHSISVRAELMSNSNLINAGRINGAGEGNAGDNLTANELAALSTKKVQLNTYASTGVSQTLVDYYASLVAKVGGDTASAKHSYSVHSTMAQELYDRSEEVSGVNLDEEMTNLIKFQSSYKAAAKLVTTADEMLQVLLSIKQ